uniref:Ig-like domain-containing protein n=1 Tax=Junco hyemalis TaxID=40217 RepID=A0A8C5IY99_JUNHY
MLHKCFSAFSIFISRDALLDRQGTQALEASRAVCVFRPLSLLTNTSQVEQEPFLETTEGTGINITCTHTKKAIGDYIHFYRLGRFSMVVYKNNTAPLEIAGVSVQDTAIYYCTLRLHLELRQISVHTKSVSPTAQEG